MLRARAHALVVIALVACAACADRAQPAGPARRVLLISCDTLRADHLGVYGYAAPTSPAVDAFARESLVFDTAYCSAPWTGPSLSSLLTGLLPDELGVPGGNRFPLPPQAVTIPEVLREARIESAAVVSNWVLRRPDRAHGDAGVAQGFTHFDDEMTSKEKNRDSFERLAPETTAAAIRWLEERKRGGDDRFFMWIHYQDPHGPYAPPDDLAAKFPRATSDEHALTLGTTNKGKGQLPAYQALDGELDPAFYRARYDAEIASFDRGFATLIDWLERNAWYDDALIVFTADHGESLGEHDYWFCHGENVQREVVRVPFIVHYPRGTQGPKVEARDGQRRTSTLVSHLDLWPTLIEAFGIAPTPNRGASLLHDTLPSERVFLQTLGLPGAPNRCVGVSDSTHHLVLAPQSAPRLFDVASDPGELHDLAPTSPELVERLLDAQRAFLAQHARTPLKALQPTADSKAEQALRKLGYTDGDDHK